MWPSRASHQPILCYRSRFSQRFAFRDPRSSLYTRGRSIGSRGECTGPGVATDRDILRDIRNRQLRVLGDELVIHRKDGRDQTTRAISSARLKASQPVHLRPINVVVSHGPLGTLRSRSVNLGDSFPLRCIQRLSAHDIAIGRCPWRDSPYTGGHFVPVLSY